MKRIAHFLCFSLLVLTFSCNPDEVFDNDNPDAKLVGEWEVKSVESKSYMSTITSPNGQTNTSVGAFVGSDIDMSITFNADKSFSTVGDYNQTLTIESPFPDPIIIEARTNDVEGGGTWRIVGDVLDLQTTSDEDFQTANLTTFTDLEMEFDYKYTRSITEGTVERTIETEVTYVLEKK